MLRSVPSVTKIDDECEVQKFAPDHINSSIKIIFANSKHTALFHFNFLQQTFPTTTTSQIKCKRGFVKLQITLIYKVYCFLLFSFLRLLYIPEFRLNKLNDGHLGVVTLAGHGSQNSGVTAGAFGISFGGGLEEGVDEVLVVDPSEGLSASVEVAALAELDHVVDVLADGLGPDEGGLDAAVADDLGGEGAEEGLALVGGLAELGHSLAVAHHGEVSSAASGDVSGFEGGHGGSGEGASTDA